MAEDVTVDGSALDLEARRLTILIHGYQNTEERAERSYGDFEAAVRSAGIPGRTLGALWHFHWPSDHRRKLVSMATYAVRVPEARSAGELLANRFLAELSPRQEVNLVAHSLGCRVALETIRTVRQAGAGWPGAGLGTIALLAAAVPQLLCTADPYPFSAPLPGSREHVFHSRRDRALGLAFDLGQRLYGEPGEAVGRDARPHGRWRSDTPKKLGHSDYWSSPSVASEIGELLSTGHVKAAASRRGLPMSATPRSTLSWRSIGHRKGPKRPGFR